MTQTMIQKLKQHLNALDEAIEYAELTDTAYTYHYTYLVRQRKLIAKTIKKLEKLEERKIFHERKHSH